LEKIELPLYYRESFFTGDSLLHPELPGGHYGISGEFVPYTVQGDDVLVALLLGCVLMAMLVGSFSSHLLTKQFKAFFYIFRSDNSEQSTPDTFPLVMFSLQTCLVLSFTYFFYVTSYDETDFLLAKPYQLIAVFFAVFVVYFLLRSLVYTIVNSVFFDDKKNRHWAWALLYVTALEGIALFPAVLLHIYSSLTLQGVLYYFVFVLILAKILTFYKCQVIFFRQNSYFLQIILYFCALEIVPLAALWGVLTVTTNVLKVIF